VLRPTTLEGTYLRRLVIGFSTLAVMLLPAAAAPAIGAVPQPSSQAAQRALDNALDAFREPLAAAGPGAGERDVTVALRDLAVALPALSGAERRQARNLLARPTDKNDRDYFGKEADDSPLCDAQFCIHWTDKAKNRPASEGFVQQIRKSVTRSHDVENDSLGWKKPKSDGKLGARHGLGKDGQTDVYVTNLGKNLYGYASTDPGQRGRKRHAYLVLDNDYTGFPSPPVKSMQVTVAHEYNHILQFNYDVFEDVWLFESTATWAEEKVYPAIDDYLYYLPTVASEPQVPMTGQSIKVYGEAVWNHWLSARFGDAVVRNVWEVSPKQEGFAVDAYDEAIENAGGPGFPRELGDFFAATAEWRSIPAFPDYSDYPDVKRSGRVTEDADKTKLDNTSYRLYKVEPTAAAVTLKVKAEKGTRSSISLVGREGGQPGALTTATRYLGKGGSGKVTLADPGRFSRVTAVVANVDGRSNKRNKRGKRVYKSDGSAYKARLVG